MPIQEETVYSALKQVRDPELMVNVVDLGLIYGIAVEDGGREVELGRDDDDDHARLSLRPPVALRRPRRLAGVGGSGRGEGRGHAHSALVARNDDRIRAGRIGDVLDPLLIIVDSEELLSVLSALQQPVQEDEPGKKIGAGQCPLEDRHIRFFLAEDRAAEAFLRRTGNLRVGKHLHFIGERVEDRRAAEMAAPPAIA